jgi:hypothetical protein
VVFSAVVLCSPNLQYGLHLSNYRTAESDVASVRTVCASLAGHIVHGGEHNPF